MRPTFFPFLSAILLTLPGPLLGQEKADKEPSVSASQLKTETFHGLRLRNIGPALTTGRIADIAVSPRNRSTWYVAVASGNLWKTTNRGMTWKPIFEQFGSYSLGCITIDPNSSDVIWL